jgi:limonene-1,2-epoxide hydrolase
VYAPDVRIWHNTDNKVQSLDENLQIVKAFVGLYKGVRFDERRRQIFPDGFVQQHFVTAIRADGTETGFSGCIICKVQNGRITHLDEYFDSAAVAAVAQPA